MGLARISTIAGAMAIVVSLFIASAVRALLGG